MPSRKLARLLITATLGAIVVWGMIGDVATPEERLGALYDGVACPVCDGSSVADSQSAYARNIRTYIAAEVAEGQSDDQIRDRLAASFGEEILIGQSQSALSVSLWLIPAVVLVVGMVASVRLRRKDGTS